MSDHIDRQAWVTDQWKKWRSLFKPENPPPVAAQVTFCWVAGNVYDERQGHVEATVQRRREQK